MINLEDLKQTIENKAGVPASLLTGETAEENIAQAKAILAFKREREAQRPKSTREQFAEWMTGKFEDRDRHTADMVGLQYVPPEAPEEAALAELEETARTEAGGYPVIKDGGQIGTDNLPDPRPTREQFAEWFGQKTAFDPFKGPDGWTNFC